MNASEYRHTVGYEAAKVAADDAVPGRSLSLVELERGAGQLGSGRDNVGGFRGLLTVFLMYCAISYNPVSPRQESDFWDCQTFSMENLAMASCAAALSALSLAEVHAKHTNFDRLLLQVIRLFTVI